MENVFEDLLADNIEADTEDDEDQEEVDFDHSFDLSDADLVSEENNETPAEPEQNAEDASENNTVTTENPTNAAFAQMRTQNKEFQNKINQLESLVKDLGMKDLDEFIAKGNEAKVKKSAASQGIPVEVARELEEMRALKNSIVAEREQNAAKQKEQVFVSNLQEFVNSNNLSKTAIDKLSQDLDRDGFSVEALMAMPKTALNKILNSYVDTKYQKNLERKDTIRKELPINQSSKIDTQSLNKEIDALARQLAGK
jgi:hypothetical protein